MPNKEQLFDRRKFFIKTARALGGLIASTVVDGCSPTSSESLKVPKDDFLTRFEERDVVRTRELLGNTGCVREFLDYDGRCVSVEYRTFQEAGITPGTEGVITAHSEIGIYACGLVRAYFEGVGICWVSPYNIKLTERPGGK